jgi:hypothetical protein
MTNKSKGEYQIEVSKGSVRKYPNVIWFPRSKTDPREIREVLKVALQVQEENPEKFFSDKTLGVKMARMGSINVIGFEGNDYIESYSGKSIGDVSYITNARMLMRLFRFLGLVTRFKKGKYLVTDLGRLYCSFGADFPAFNDGVSEEKMLLDSLSNFAFYSVNDDSAYRDNKFKIRPFFWLLYSLRLEPQCIYQLIITTFASHAENGNEVKRITNILGKLRSGETNLKKEWKNVGLDPDDYSCVHNFYDSAKILVYLGVSLGLIKKSSDPVYGKKISGNAKNLKQATIFYLLTEKGKKFVEENFNKTLIYYDDLYNEFGDPLILKAAFLLATLNFELGNKKVISVSKNFFDKIKEIDDLIIRIKSTFGIEIIEKDSNLTLITPVSFSFFQSIPPEIMHLREFSAMYNKFISKLDDKNVIFVSQKEYLPTSGDASFTPSFNLDDLRRYVPSTKIGVDNLENAIKYEGKDSVSGGSDRFSSRVSPTTSVVFENGKLMVNNSIDSLDLLVPLRLRDRLLSDFIESNTIDLVTNFLAKSDTWEKDQHYVWVRNCFRHFGMEASYSGSGGMLSRADITVSKPIIGGIEAKSPRENRGTLNLKAIRQAIEAKVQVSEKINNSGNMPEVAIAIGRRISTLALNAEKSWSKQNQPVLLITDAILYYLIIKSATIEFSLASLVKFLTENHGQVTQDQVYKLFSNNCKDKNYLNKVKEELVLLDTHFSAESED